MPTGQTVITNALIKLQLLEQGGTPSASDSVAVLNELNNMWPSWGIDEGLIYGQQTYQNVLTANQAVYSIGSSGDFNTSRPQRIYKAFVLGVAAVTGTTASGSAIVLFTDTSVLVAGQQIIGAGIPPNSFIRSIVTNTSALLTNQATASGTVSLYATTGNRNEMKIVAAGEYYDHNDLGALAYTPDQLYPDYLTSGTNGLMNLHFWPVPKSSSVLAVEIDMAVIFSTWALGTSYQIPPGYQDAIEWTLAFRCVSMFGEAVSQETVQMCAMEASKAEARLRKANSFNRQAPDAVMAVPGAPPAQAA